MSATSDLIGRSVRDIQWQGRFGTVLVGVQRGNGREDGRLSDIVVAAKDVFILDTSEKSCVSKVLGGFMLRLRD